MWTPIRLAVELRGTARKAKQYKGILKDTKELLRECQELLRKYAKTPGVEDKERILEADRRCGQTGAAIDNALKDEKKKGLGHLLFGSNG